MLCLAMYGFMLSFLSSGISPLTKTAAASLGTSFQFTIFTLKDGISHANVISVLNGLSVE